MKVLENVQYAPKVLSGVYVIIASPLGITAPCSFFLCVGLPLWMLLTKFHQPQTKTFCLRGDIVDRTIEWKSLDSTPVPEEPGGVDASPLGITAPCSFFLCVGLPLWMLLTKFHQPQTKTFCLRGDLVDCTTERKSLDSTPVPEEPGGVNAEEAAGRHRWQWQPHQVLACQSEQQWALFRAKIVSIRDF